jgi:hypothetical protein
MVLNNTFHFGKTFSWLFAGLLITIGILNLFLIHPVPGIAYLLISCLYMPPVNESIRNRFGFAIPVAVRIALGIAIMWFTLGISDLGDMYF